MTNDYAIYLVFIAIAIIMGVVGLYFKKGWSMLLGAMCWVFTAFYCFTTATPTTQYIYLLGVFSLAAAVAYVITSIRVNPKVKVVPPPEVSHMDHLSSYTDQVRKSRNRFKTNIRNDGRY